VGRIERDRHGIAVALLLTRTGDALGDQTESRCSVRKKLDRPGYVLCVLENIRDRNDRYYAVCPSNAPGPKSRSLRRSCSCTPVQFLLFS